MQRCKVDLFGSNEVIVGFVSQVLDVFDDEGITEGVLGEEDDLGASCRKCSNRCFAYTACTALLCC